MYPGFCLDYGRYNRMIIPKGYGIEGFDLQFGCNILYSRGKNVGWWPAVVVLAAKSGLPNGCVTFRGFNEHLSEELVIDRIVNSSGVFFYKKCLLPNMVIEFHDCDGNSWRMLANTHTAW